MASSAFTANGSSSPVAVAAGATVTLALTSVTGVRLIEWSILGGSDSTQSTPTITPAGTPSGATATFTMSSTVGAVGVSWIVQCRINGGVDDAGQVVSSYTTTAIVGVLNVNGYLPFAVGEKLERNSTNGIANDLNAQLGGGAGASIGLIIAISKGNVQP